MTEDAGPKPIRVAMLTTVGDRCGIAAYSRDLISGLSTLPDVHVTVVPITEGRQSRDHYVAQAEILNGDEVDVVHIQHEHSFWGGILPRQSAYWDLRYLIKKPLVLTAHTTYSLGQLLRIKQERRPHKWLAKRLLLANKGYRDSVETAPFVTAVCIVHTAEARQELIARGAMPSAISVVPAGVPQVQRASDAGAAFRTRHGLQNNRIVTIFGYIAPNKGYELTLDILPRLPPDVILVIAGGSRVGAEQTYADTLQQRICDAGLAQRVLVTGYLEEDALAEALAASDVVLAPHTWATGSYSVTLPIAHGRPVLASDLACFRDIRDRIDCIGLFRAGDRDDYTEKLSSLLGDEDRRSELAAADSTYAEKFSWPAIARVTRNIYTNAIQVYERGHKPTWSGTPHKHFR